MIKLYGAPGWGSAISEVMLTLADIPYEFINVDGFDAPGPQRELLQRLNPLCQVPTLALENGAIMTETAAIALMVLDRCPDLAPPVGQAERQRFLCEINQPNHIPAEGGGHCRAADYCGLRH